MSLYPFKFKPVFKEKVWGGQKIKSELGLDFAPLDNCGEAWMLSGIDETPSVVTNGFLADNELNELVEVYMGDLVGDKVYEKFGNVFPLLIKFLDSREWLSVQVHPDDALAKKKYQSYGKTEMWYVLQADENAELISGFNGEINEQKYLKAMENNSLKSILKFDKVADGDVFFIPAGRVHALGPGNLLLEIQQTSDITFRIYDWDRKDDKGKTRELHTEEALKAINYSFEKKSKTQYETIENASSPIIKCDHFNTSILSLTETIERDFLKLDSFVIYICTEGSAEIIYHDGNETISKGEVILIPAGIKEISLSPKGSSKLIEVYID